MFIKSNLLKIVGVATLLVCNLTIPNPASALNTAIGNLVGDTNLAGTSFGQSFINDPLGTGAAINLNTWTYAAGDNDSLLRFAGAPLSIFNGIGNGGRLVGTSRSTSSTTLGGFPSVTWTFAGGLGITDNLTYTAVLPAFLLYKGSINNPYPNGLVTVGTTTNPRLDSVFQGTFSTATPVPLEFSPVLGLSVLGGIASFRVGSRLIKKAKSAKNA